MNHKFLGLLKVLGVALAISAAAGCATVQSAFAPGMVAQAKSADNDANVSYHGALIPGSVDLSITARRPSIVESGALVPGSVDLAIFGNGSDTAYSGALVPGSVDLSRTLGAAAPHGAMVPAADYMYRFRR